MTISKNGVLLTTLDDWRQRAGPKGGTRQWKSYRSAKEGARAWLSSLPAMPAEVTRVLATHPAFGEVARWEAEPEVKLRFDTLGEARNTDLLVRGIDPFGEFWLAVECKADEAFGESITSAARAAEARIKRNAASNGLTRLWALCTTLLGATVEDEPTLGRLRYQLLTATAGAIQAAHASGVKRIVLLVQEFASANTSVAKHASNGRAIQQFVERFTRGAVINVPTDQLVELSLPCDVVNNAIPPRFFIAKVTRMLPPGLD